MTGSEVTNAIVTSTTSRGDDLQLTVEPQWTGDRPRIFTLSVPAESEELEIMRSFVGPRALPDDVTVGWILVRYGDDGWEPAYEAMMERS